MWLLSKDELKKEYEKGLVAPVLFRFKSRLEPQSVYSLFKTNSPSVLLESPAEVSDTSHAYSYAAWDPFLSVRIEAQCAKFTYRNGKETQSGLIGHSEARRAEESASEMLRFAQHDRAYETASRQSRSALEILRSLFATYKGTRWNGINFFTGGAVVAFSYELANQFEKLPPAFQEGDKVPDVLLAVYDRVAAIDRGNHEITLCLNLLPESGVEFNAAYACAVSEIQSWAEKIEMIFQTSAPHPVSVADLRACVEANGFHQIVRKAKEYIGAGDIYQVNLSQRFEFSFSGDAFGIYERLQKINPSPFSLFADWGDIKMVSSSPERLVRLRGNVCETRPIAGTRPRGRDDLERDRLRQDLLLSEKERAEHLMLVDLERNDLGRVCDYGTVRVDEYMTVECYSHVQHIVSNVTGRLKPEFDQFDLIRAMFPGGTITGCPKIRCMEIIHELERERRGFYTGSVGYLGFNGDMDLNILIRTIILDGNKGSFRVGAGIVWDSKEEAEYKETLDKASALFEALVDSSECRGLRETASATQASPYAQGRELQAV